MAKVLVAPNGLQIQGTLERVHGAGLMTNIRLEDGKIAFDYGGETKMWWEEQLQAVDDKGESLFVDTQGNEWPESQLKLVDED